MTTLDATAVEALHIVRERLISVVHYSLDQGLKPNRMDEESLRLALAMMDIVAKGLK